MVPKLIVVLLVIRACSSQLSSAQPIHSTVSTGHDHSDSDQTISSEDLNETIHPRSPAQSSENDTNFEISSNSSTPSSAISAQNFTNDPNLIDEHNFSKVSTTNTAPRTVRTVTAISVSTKESGIVEIGADYWIVAVMQIPRWIDITTANFLNELHMKLRNLVNAAVERQQARRYGLSGNLPSQGTGLDKNDVIVQVMNISRQERNNNVQTTFLTRYKQAPMPASTLIEDLRHLSSAEQSAVMGYPVQEIKTYLAEEETEKRNLWIIGAVIGSVVGVLLCGWCILFAYYNTCGRLLRYSKDQEEDRRAAGQDSASTDRDQGTATKNSMAERHGALRRGILKNPMSDEVFEENNGRPNGTVEKIYLISTEAQTDFGNGGVQERIREDQTPIDNREKSAKLDSMVQSNGGGSSASTSIGARPPPSTIGGPKFSAAAKGVGKKLQTAASKAALTSPEPSASGSSAVDQGIGSTGGDVSSVIGTIGFNNSGNQVSIADSKQLTPMPDIRTAGDSMKVDHVTDMISPLRPQNNASDIWSLYPWRPYQAGDQTYLLAQGVTDHPSPYQTTGPDGSIVMHSKLLTPGTTMPKAENAARRLIIMRELSVLYILLHWHSWICKECISTKPLLHSDTLPPLCPSLFPQPQAY